MYYLYKITNEVNGKIYIGMTNDPTKRFASHKSGALNGKGTYNYFYNAIRKYGIENFKMEILAIFDNKDDCACAEIAVISFNKKNGIQNYNLHTGGTGGFSVKELDTEAYNSWHRKIVEARQGLKPALGMKHTEENKEFFGLCGRLRWDIYGRYPVDEVLKLRFIDANKTYGISKTHYYRLRKQRDVDNNQTEEHNDTSTTNTLPVNPGGLT